MPSSTASSPPSSAPSSRACCSPTPRRGRFATSSTACSASWRSSRTRTRRASFRASVLSALGAQAGPAQPVRPAHLVRGPGVPLCRRVRRVACSRAPSCSAPGARQAAGPDVSELVGTIGGQRCRRAAARRSIGSKLDLAQVSGAVNSYQLDGQLVVELDLTGKRAHRGRCHARRTDRPFQPRKPAGCGPGAGHLAADRQAAGRAGRRARGVRRRAAPAPGQPPGIPGRVTGVGSLGAERGPNQLFDELTGNSGVVRQQHPGLTGQQQREKKMTDLNARPAGNRIWLLAGLLAVVAVAGYFSLNYPPAGEDAAGTIAAGEAVPGRLTPAAQLAPRRLAIRAESARPGADRPDGWCRERRPGGRCGEVG